MEFRKSRILFQNVSYDVLCKNTIVVLTITNMVCIMWIVWIFMVDYSAMQGHLFGGEMGILWFDLRIHKNTLYFILIKCENQ